MYGRSASVTVATVPTNTGCVVVVAVVLVGAGVVVVTGAALVIGAVEVVVGVVVAVVFGLGLVDVRFAVSVGRRAAATSERARTDRDRGGQGSEARHGGVP